MRQPTFFIPHGGGPCFFMDWDPPDTWDRLGAFLRGLVPGLVERPRAILCVTAHWEAPAFTLSAVERPRLYYDYYGFPPHTYRLSWPVAGDPALARHAAELLDGAGLPAALDTERGYDHGVFVPLKVALPEADIPTVQMSIQATLAPRLHMAAGRALAPLRDEGVLIIGSGLSYHNMRGLMGNGPAPGAAEFDAWLTEAVTADPAAREDRLAGWEAAPGARLAHPREEHLVPLFVAAGAAPGEPGERVFHQDNLMNAAVSAYRFG